MAKTTIYRSAKGTNTYATRDKQGKFKNIPKYRLATGLGIKRKSSGEELNESAKRFSRALRRLAER